MKKQLNYFFWVLIIFPFVSFAQNVVKGKVVNSKSERIIAASVKEKGTNKGTITDQNGDFQLSIADKSTLISRPLKTI